MNARCFKTVFSKRLGARVAVGEHASSQGKATGAGGFAGDASQPGAFLGCVEHQGDGLINGFWGVLSSTFALVALVWATPAWAQPAPNALPTGGQVVQGAVQFNQSAQQLNITQSTDRAAVNWQSFDIGVAAKVNIQQPSAQSVLLNRVGGESPSQIFGQLQANGKVILVNPNGLVIGRDGSVSAAGFTGSTLNISDADFMAGQARFSRSGAGTGSVLNQGRIEVTRGGYVALLGASVSNEGAIVAPQGHVFLAAADGVNIPAELPGPGLVGVPIGQSGRIRLELTPASINAAVANHKGGTIVTEGGQVYLQAAALNQAMATVLQSGSIDTTGVQGGQVHVLADGGRIRVDGEIKANSTGTDDKGQPKAGGDIYIGRDRDTNVLAAVGDASGAQLESLGGFVETSGQFFKVNDIRVKAKDWLLDPTSIRIVATNSATPDTASSTSSGTTTFQDNTPSGGASTDTSEVLKSTIESAINNGTNVTITTANPNSGGVGDITIETALSFTNNSANAATLRLIAVNGITQNSGSTITATGSQLVHVVMDANGRYIGQDVPSNLSRGITLTSAITTNGDLTLTGRTIHTDATNATNGIAVSTQSGANLTARNISVTGNSSNSFDLNIQGGMTVTGGIGANLTLTGNTLSLSGNTVSAGAGTVTIQNRTAGTLIDVGGASADVLSSPQKLGVSSAELGLISAGNLVIGRNDSLGSGLLTVAGALNVGALGNTSGNLTLVSGGDLLLAQNQSITKSTGSEATLTMRANGDINLWNGSSISSASNKLNVVLNSDADANNAGAVRLILSSITSNGGNITMGGGVNAAGYASGSGTLANGIWFNGSNLFSGGGNIALKGRSSASTNSDGGASAGIWFRDEAATIDINAGSGTITMDGLSQSTHASAHTHGVMVGGFGTRTTIQSSSSAAKAIDITGVGSASSPNASGIWINGTASMLSTGTGGISLDGTDRSATGAGETAGVFFKNGRVLSASGLVQITGASQVAYGVEMNWSSGQGGIIGSQSGSSITSSSANIVLNADSIRLGTTPLSAINTTGSVSLRNRTAGIGINIGAADTLGASGTLGLLQDELNVVRASHLIIGQSTSGNILVSSPVTTLSTSGNVSVISGGSISVNQSLTAGANLILQTNGGNIANTAAISGVNVSIDNTNGSINGTTGVITVGSANSGSAVGVSVGSSITATGNLNIWGASTNNTGINVLANSTLRGGNIQATGRVNTGGYGLLLNAGSSVITTGTSGDSLVRGINTNGGSNAVLTGGTPTLTAATGTTLTLWGDGTNTGDRAMRVDGGATTNGAVTIRGTSNNATALLVINGSIRANANSALTLQGTTSGTGRNGVETVNSGGVSLSNGATLLMEGQNTAATGAGVGINLQGVGIIKVTGATSVGQVTLVGSASSSSGATGAFLPANITSDSSITITGNVTSAASTGVSIAGAVVSTGTGTTIGVSSNQGITGTGAIGSTTFRNANVTFTHAGTSTYSGAINAANFTKAGAGSLTLDSWVATTPANTNISNAYTVSSGSLSLSPHMNYAGIDPASVNVVNNATFSLSNAGNGFWRNTAFNFTGGQGGGTMNLLGNPIGISNTTNTFSTSGGATNTINGLLNANNANVNLNLAAATSGTTLLDGSFAALVFAQNIQGGFGLDNATTINTNGPGGLLFLNRVKATQLNVNSGTVQFGNGSAATAAATPELQATNVAIASGAQLILNRAEAQSNASVFTGAGSLTQAGAGTLTLTGNSSGFAGGTTVNAGRSLVIGTNGNLGAAGSTLSLASATSSVGFTNTAGTSTIGSTISGAGTFSKSGAGTGVLTANNTYTGTTTVSGGTLQVGNGGSTGTLGTGGAVTLSNNAVLSYVRSADTTIANNISGTGSVSASITGVGSDLAVSHAIALTAGTVNLAADGHLSLAQGITTTNTTTSALVLNAGAAANAGTSTGGDISFTGSGAVSVGAGGRATLFTGSLSGSTGLGITVGNNRYNSDELTTNYTAALGSGTFAVYREAPILNVRFNDAVKTYDALAFTGGNGLSVVSGFINGDTSTTFSGITYSGTAQNATNSGSYAISGTALNSQGYALGYTSGTLTVNKANLVLTGTREYDATTTFAGQHLTATGVAGQTFSLTGSGHSSNLASKHVANNQNVALSSVTGLSLGASSNGGLAANYNDLSTAGSSVSVSAKTASVNATPTTVTYSGLLQSQNAFTSVGFIAGDAVTFSGLASGINAGTYASNIAVNGADAGNYTIALNNANLVVQKANLVLSGSRVYDGGTTFAGAFLTAAGVNNETFAVTGLGDHSNLTSKNVAANQAVALNSVTGLALGSSSNGGLSTNYNALSTAGSSVSLSLKSASVTGTSTQLVYNGHVQTQQAATTSGFVGGDVITVSGLASGKNAGTYTSQLLVGGADAANYSVAYNNANLVIGKASLTATANSSTVTYNAEIQSVAGFTVTGLLGSDQLSDLTGLSAGGASGTLAGSYTNFMTSGAQTNYVVNAVNGTLTINKAPLTVTGHSASVTYNGFDQSVSGFSVSGLKGNDTVNSLGSVQARGAIGKNAGVYTNTVEVGTETNYTVTAVNGTLTIGKAALTATGNSAQVTYNGASQSVSGFTLTGLLGADTAADITQVSASGASGTDVGAYVNTVTAGVETNYTVTPVNGLLSIGKANLILSGSRVYDRTTSFAGGFLTASGVAGQTFSVSGAGDASNLASKNVQSSQSLSSVTGLSLGASTNGGLSSNYNALSATGSSVSVTPLTASVSGTAASVVYSGSTQNQAVTSSGFIAGDDVVISGWASGKAAGTYGSSLSLTGADAANYSVAFHNANWVITPAPLVVTATAVTKTYDGKLKATGSGTVGVLAGAAAGEAVLSAGVQSFLDKDAGTGKTVRASGVKIKDSSGQDVTANYAISYVDNTSSTINKAMLTITANDDARFVTQSDAVGFNGVSYTGLVYGETSSVLGGSLSIARTNAATQDAGSYNGVLVPSGLTSNNYQISFANGNYTIIPANQLLIRTANLTGSSSVVYGSAINFDATAQYLDGNNQVIHTLSRTGSNGLFTFSDGANGAVSVALKPYNGASLASASSSGHTVVGNYAIRDLSPLVTGGNFSGSPIFVGALQVDPKAVTPNASGVAKTYDGTTSMNNVVVGLTGKLGNDDLSISGSGAFAQRHVGTGLAYTISDVVLAGADAANYYLMGASNSFSGNDGVISRAPLVISTANVVKTYDRTTSALGQAVAVQGTQLFSGDSFSGGTFAFTNANAGSGNKTVTVSGVAVNDGNGGGNYSISFANNTSSTIQARALQANFAASSKVYDGTDTAQVSGNTADVIAGDTVFLVKTGAVFNDKNVGAGKSVTVSGISLAGADAANYSLQNTSALSSADITPKPLTASFTTSARAYDGSTTATVLGSSTDKVAGDNLVFNAGSAHFASADAGANKQVTLTGLSLGGADAGNYALQNTSATSTGTINRRDVSLTGLTAANKVYDGTTSAVITSGVIATGVSGESLNVTGTGAFASKLVGNNKSVTVADVSALTKVNGTGHWNNYRLVTTGSLSTHATITPAPLTVTANAVNKTYDGLLSAPGIGTVGALAGAGDAVSSFGVQSFLDKNVGIGNKAVRASGVTITDAANADMTGNYQITYVDSLTGSIVRAPLIVKINNTSMFVTQVPDTAVDNGFSVTGLVNGESASSVLGPMSRRYTGAPNVPVGNYAGVFDLSATPSAANYSVSVQKGDLTVVPADMLLVHLGSGSEAYGVLTAANAGSASSSVMAQYCLVASDCNGANITNLAMTRQGSRWTATDASNSTISFDTAVNTAGRLSAGGFVNAGHYVWAASGLTTTGALNFNGTAINAGVLTVNPKLLSLGAGNVTKVYDGTNALVGRALTPDGVMPADAINVVSTGGSFAGKSAGQHGFTLTGLKLQGADWANYGLAGENVTGTGLITPKALQWFASVEDKVYDGNTSAVLRSLALSGIVDGDHVNATGGTAHFASKNVARDAAGQVQSQDVTVSGVVLTGASASNYSLLTTSLITRSSITPKMLQASAAVDDKVYDGSATASLSGLNGTGVLAGDSVSVGASGARFEDKRVSRDANGAVMTKLVTVEDLRLAGTDAGNYALAGSSLTARAKILPLDLDVQVSAQDKVYDGSAVATGSLSLSPVVAGDVLTLSWGRASFDSKDVQRDAQGGLQAQGVRFESVSLSGADSGNYSLRMDTALGMATITPKRLEVIGTQVADKTEDGSVRADVRMGDLSGLVGAEQLRALASGQFRTPGAGQNKPVDVLYSLQDGENGGKAGNYELMGQTLKASITPVNALLMPRTEAPMPSENTRLRVSFDQSRWASFAPAQSNNGRKGEVSVDSATCSAQTPNNCSCSVGTATGVEVCLPVRDK